MTRPDIKAIRVRQAAGGPYTPRQEDVGDLLACVDDLKGALRSSKSAQVALGNELDECRDNIGGYLTRLEAYETALNFYADPRNYIWDIAPDPAGTPIPGTSPIDGDAGERARALLPDNEERT